MRALNAAMRAVGPALLTAATLLLAVAIVEIVMPRADFDPFVMRIEVEGSPPTILRYTDRSNWTSHWDGDAYTYACHDGLYGHFDEARVFRVHAPIEDAIRCPAPARWIGYGWAWSVPWPSSQSGNTITYTNGGERVVFDRTTGFPILYEAGPSDSSPPTYRVIFTVVK